MSTITKRVTTITLIGEVTEVKFNRGYPYFEVVNNSDAPVYLSRDEECEPNADGVYTVPANGGKVARLDTSVIYLNGSGTVQVTAKYEAEPSFKSASKGGEGGGTAGIKVLLNSKVAVGETKYFDVPNDITMLHIVPIFGNSGNTAPDTMGSPTIISLSEIVVGNNYISCFGLPGNTNRAIRETVVLTTDGKYGIFNNGYVYSFIIYGIGSISSSGGGVDEAYVIGKMTQAVNTSKAYTDDKCGDGLKIAVVDTLPLTGEEDTIYIYNPADGPLHFGRTTSWIYRGKWQEMSDYPTYLADLTDDADHRTVTDAEKTAWNSKTKVEVSTFAGTTSASNGHISLVVKPSICDVIGVAFDNHTLYGNPFENTNADVWGAVLKSATTGQVVPSSTAYSGRVYFIRK